MALSSHGAKLLLCFLGSPALRASERRLAADGLCLDSFLVGGSERPTRHSLGSGLCAGQTHNIMKN